MKTICAILCFCLIAISSFAQTDAQRIDSVKAMISREQYLAAYRILETVQEPSPDLVILLTDVLVDHAGGISDDYDRWTLENKIRRPDEKQETVEIDLEKVIWVFIQKYPDDCRVNSTISRLYFKFTEVEDLFLPLHIVSSVRERIEKYVPAKCADYRSNYLLGYTNNYLGNPQAALSFLQKSIALQPKFAPAYKELANSYLQTKDYTNAVKNANKAFELSTSRRDKSKAALLLAQAYEGMNDNTRALINYNTADTLSRYNFFNQKALVAFYVKTGDSRANDAINKFIGGQGRHSLHNYLDVLEIYTTYKRQSELAIFLQKWLEEYKGRKDIESCINFTLGKIYQNINSPMATLYFKTAKDMGIKASSYPATRNHPNTGKLVEEAFRNIK